MGRRNAAMAARNEKKKNGTKRRHRRALQIGVDLWAQNSAPDLQYPRRSSAISRSILVHPISFSCGCVGTLAASRP